MGTPFIRPFSDAAPYDQDEPGDAAFHWLLEKDEVPGLQMGLVDLKGPIHKTPAIHKDFHQTYLLLSGSATVHLDGRPEQVAAPAVVVIPKHTLHSVEVPKGGALSYIFVNQLR